MCVLLIGGDNLGNINKNLHDLGFTEIIHMDGRKDTRKKQQCKMQSVKLV